MIVLHVVRDGGMYFASNDTLIVCGYGATLHESITEAVKHIKYFREYYRRLPEDKVTGEAVRLKQVFQWASMRGEE